MIAFDAHLDLAWNALDFNRNLLLPVAEIRKYEQSQKMAEKGRGRNTVSFPDLRRGKVAVVISTLIARLLRPGSMPEIQRYTSMEAAYAAAHGQMAYYRSLVDQGVLRWIKDWPTLEAHVAEWKKDEQGKQPIGFILSMEGADPVLSPEQVAEWYEYGLRIIGPAHYGPSPYAMGHDQVGKGLTERGPAFLKAMDRVGMILDVTHLSDKCFYEALDIYGGPLLASHHNSRTLVPNVRQLTDDQIKRIVERKGVIGTALDAWMMVPNWNRGETLPEQTGVKMEHMIDHIDKVCQLAGNAKHAAIGTDLDGGYGTEQTPADLDTIADLQMVPDLLRKRGYPEPDIEGIMHGNWVRFFREVWSKKS
jgi:membrane dipeptidase